MKTSCYNLSTTLPLATVLLLTTTNGSKFFASAFQFPETTGKYATGTCDYEFLDEEYPSPFPADSDGRRIMFRAWYPTCEKTKLSLLDDGTTTICQQEGQSTEVISLGRRRKYFEPGEWEAFFGESEPIGVTSTFDLTYSYINAPPFTTTRSDSENKDADHFPVIIYTHGFGMYVADNTALLEEIASHGYTVFAIGSPGFSSGVLYPNDQHVVTSTSDYPEINATVAVDEIPSPFAGPFSLDLQERYERQKLYLEEGAVPNLVDRLRDDMLALANYLDSGSSFPNPPGQDEELSETPTRSGDDTDFSVHDLIGNNKGLNQRLMYMGFSLGGSAAGSASQQDERALAAINIDGAHQSLDLFGSPIRVPYMHFMSNIELIPFYYNEFFFEELEVMGTRNDVTRVLVSDGVGHLDFSDYKLLDQNLRQALLGMPPVDGVLLHSMTSAFCLSFLDAYVVDGGEDDDDGNDWASEDIFSDFSDFVERVDVSYVADWAQSLQATEAPDDSASSSRQSMMTMASMGLSLVLGTFVVLVGY